MAEKEEKRKLRKQVLKARDAIDSEQKKLWDNQILKYLKAYDKKSPCLVYLCYVSYRSEVSTREFIEWCLSGGKLVFVPKVMQDGEGPAGLFESEPQIYSKHNRAFEFPGAMPSRQAALAWKMKEKKRQPVMSFYKISALTDLQAGYQGIPEPRDCPENAFSTWIAGRKNVTARMLLPGAVFDRKGNRIGYGGGFYDRWLDKWEHERRIGEEGKNRKLEKIGLSYELQVLPSDVTGGGREIPTEPFDWKVDGLITEKEFLWN